MPLETQKLIRKAERLISQAIVSTGGFDLQLVDDLRRVMRLLQAVR